MSDLSSMRVQGSSNDERGYDGVSEAAGSVRVSRDGYVDTTGLRPGGKEPAVQGCGCMTAATFVKMVRSSCRTFPCGGGGRGVGFRIRYVSSEIVEPMVLLIIIRL